MSSTATTDVTPPSASALLTAIITTLEDELIPLTLEAAKTGGAPFGGAVLDNSKPNLELVTASVNPGGPSPLTHGETDTIRKFFAVPSTQRPSPKECIFFATHEPCAMCIGAIAWSGFPLVYYLFGYEETRPEVAELEVSMHRDIWHVGGGEEGSGVGERPVYNRRNRLFTARSVEELLGEVDDEGKRDELKKRIDAVRVVYDRVGEEWVEREKVGF